MIRKKIMTYVLTASFLISGAAISVSDTTEAAGGTWKNDSKGWWFSYSDGSYARNEWLKNGGRWYHFDAAGYMQTGWQKISEKWYYFASSGAMQTGWKKISGKWYYFASSGAMQTGWKKISGKWYYFESSGAMHTGWRKLSEKWYYFESSGAMITGWRQISGKWYYFESSGEMQTGTVTIKGKSYTFDSNGVWEGESSTGLASANVGDYVTFGRYEQDNDPGNGEEDISWKVLAKEGGKLLLISEYALDAIPYNEMPEDITWETSGLRKWMNNEFYDHAFNSAEKEMIQSSVVRNDDNPVYGTEGGNDTVDRVFLLSLDEALKYFGIPRYTGVSEWVYGRGDEACCKPTAYAIEHGAYTNTIHKEENGKYLGNATWWLRSTGKYQFYASIATYGGGINAMGGPVRGFNYAFRPVIRVQP